ncbi:MAG: hypothetical protein [Cressdnaviricota sp.]|nr:MAG: hypothetical protein [Cressdnaviricota sp.]
MAKRKYNQKARALQPAVMKLHFRLDANAEKKYIDLSECTSRLNRRFMRQGLNWAVANVKITMLPTAPGTVPAQAYVNTIPHTWLTANSWVKCFHAWKDQQDEALADFDGADTASRFRDFKIFADTDHVTSTFLNNLTPYTLGPGTTAGPYLPGLITGAAVLPSENWQFSEIVIPNQTADASGSLTLPAQYSMHMVGPDTSGFSRGMISGYQNSRNFPQSPDPVNPALGQATNWMMRMQDVGSDSGEVVQNATERNDELPYDQEEYPGVSANIGQLETQGYVLNASTVGVTTFNTGPFTAPCGLIRLDFQDQSASGDVGTYNIVTVELVPGNHRGYLCETMEEF